MQDINQIIEKILDEEGAAYTNDPRDSGGPTKYGITQAALAAWRGHPVTPEDVRFLLMDEAAKIYRDRYYQKPGFADVATLSPTIAAKLTDCGVNMGPPTAATFLQRALNIFNQGGKLYSDISADGQIGPGTLGALQSFLAARGKDGELVLLRAINCLQGAKYVALAEQNPKNEAFVYGWIAQRVS